MRRLSRFRRAPLSFFIFFFAFSLSYFFAITLLLSLRRFDYFRHADVMAIAAFRAADAAMMLLLITPPHGYSARYDRRLLVMPPLMMPPLR